MIRMVYKTDRVRVLQMAIKMVRLDRTVVQMVRMVIRMVGSSDHLQKY